MWIQASVLSGLGTAIFLSLLLTFQQKGKQSDFGEIDFIVSKTLQKQNSYFYSMEKLFD